MATCFRLLLVGFAALTACGGRALLSAPEEAGSDQDVTSPTVDASVDAVDADSSPDTAADVGDSRPGVQEGGPEDAPQDAPQDVTADAPAGGDGGTVYNDMTDPSFWSTYNSGVDGSAGGTFDGRYVYFAPNPTAVVTRYDTQASFTTASSWTTFDATALNPNGKGFYGSAFDGRYVYFVPGSNGVIVRFDTQGAFGASSSWSAFDVGTAITGFYGAVFDGQYLYFVPFGGVVDGGVFAGGVVARYDTHAAFAASSSWTTYTIPGNGNAINVMGGGVFDGRYVYLPLYYAGLVRYDTQASFTAASSWASNGGMLGQDKSNGLAFDGRYVYTLSPDDYTGLGYDRYDTTSSFTASTSWSQSYPSFGGNLAGGAAFDGRYVYVVPRGPTGYSSACCQAIRYDTQMPFQPFQSSAWSAFDVTTVSSAIAGFHGAVFDGRYVYFVPATNGMVARFDAKTPRSMPVLPAWSGSFF